MACDVDICNLALSCLGDEASVSSIDPPEGSAQAQHCARFYPLARDALLALHPWSFATHRTRPPRIEVALAAWNYAYALPSDAIEILAVQPAEAPGDATAPPLPQTAAPGGAVLTRAFAIEVLESGERAILTDEDDALIRYTARSVDPSAFPPLFVLALAWHLASMLAGALLRGPAGADEAKRCAAMMASYLVQARAADAGQRKVALAHCPAWIAGR